jgi:hypothetical protein
MMASVKYANIIKTQETAFKNIIAIIIFTVNPPGEID